MNLIQQLEAEQISKLTDGKSIPDFAAGDTVRVNVRVVDARASACRPTKASASPARTAA